jgi:SET domain-containing protein
MFEERCNNTNNHYYTKIKNKDFYIDAAYVSNKMRFINHHCTDPNVDLV